MASLSIIEESKKAKGKGFLKKIFNKKTFIVLIILLVVGGGAYYYFSTKNAKTTTVVTKKNVVVQREDLQISVETSGKVVAKDGVELSFSTSDSRSEVSDVYVKEGDTVKKGDKIASIKTSSLEFDLRSAYSNYQSALSSYQTKVAGATSDDKAKSQNSIDQAQLSLDQAKLSLEQTKTNGDNNIKTAENNVTTAQNNLRLNSDEKTSAIVNDAYTSLVNTLKSVNISISKNLEDADSILGVDDSSLNYSFEELLGVKNSGTFSAAKDAYLAAKIDKNNLNSAILSLNSNDQNNIDVVATKASQAIDSMDKLLYDTKLTLDATIVSSTFSQSQLDTLRSKINSDRSGITSTDSSLTNALQSVDSAKRSLSNYQLAYQKAQDDLVSTKATVKQNIANSENSVATRQSSLESAQLSYKTLIAPATASDLASARAQLTSASISVDKAKYNIEQATITSPIDGVVAALNYKKGDIIIDDKESVVTIINKDTLYIEVNVEESDINKIKVGQKVEATFDAIEGLSLDGEVSFISLTSLSSSNGIVTYLVRVLFVNPGETEVREGMTASVKLITSEAADVLAVPVNAVRNVNNEVVVQKADGTYATVVTGFTDGTKVEIISGLNEGDKITY